MENDGGAQYALHVYSAKSSPSIGGNRDIEGIEDAALELKQYISKAAPSDYTYTGIYKNKSRIIMGVLKGEPYYFEFKFKEKQEDDAIKRDYPLTIEQLAEEKGWKAKWKAEGEEQKALAIAQNLANLGLPVETVISATGLDPEKVKTLYKTNNK